MAEASPLFSTYNRAPLSFERGDGVWLTEKSGERYLDLAAGIAVSVVGHSHPHLTGKLKEQIDKVWHLSNVFEIPEQTRLAERLVQSTFADKVFFTNSGAEAMECAIKTARRYFYAKGEPERYRIVTIEGAFHGRTLGTIAAGGQKKYLEGFGPPVEGFDQVPFGDHEALKAAIGPETAAILVEPVQGEGGIRVIPDQCLRGLRDLCDEHGLLLIMDEIQCGMGRTGKLFAHEWAGITPDIMAVAKALGGGFPVGACLATEEAASGMVAGTHGTTYGGNPLAMTAGNAVMDLMSDDFLTHVSDVALQLRQGLESLKDRYPGLIAEIRGKGLMLGIRCIKPNTDLLAALRSERVLTVPAGDNVIRLLPPLVLSADEAREALSRIDAALAMLSGQPAAAE